MRVFGCAQKKRERKRGRVGEIGREREREGVMRRERARIRGREIERKRDREE